MNLLKSVFVALFALTGMNFAVNQIQILPHVVIPAILLFSCLLLFRNSVLLGDLPRPIGIFIVVSAVIFIIYGSCVLMVERDVRTITNLDFLKLMLRFSVISSSFIFGYLQNWHNRLLRESLSIIGSVCLVYLCFMKIGFGLEDGFVVEKFHSNQLGIMGVIAVYYGVLFLDGQSSNRTTQCLLIAGLVATLVSNSRGCWLCLLLFFLFLWVQRFMHSVNSLRMLSFPLIVAFSLCVTFIYATLADSEYFGRVSEISERMIGKQLDTGRAKLWREAAEDFRESPWFGHGLYSHDSWTRKFKDGTVISLSVHNYYWAILHETGIIGMAGILTLFFVIWHAIVLGRDERFSRIALAFFGAILIQEISEVQLSTGTFTVGTSVWIAIAAGTSLAHGSRQRVFVLNKSTDNLLPRQGFSLQ
ncbi:MAG: O-antigen ligase family protein [Planctomyces sp.]